MDSKADDAPSELVHDHEYPVALQKNGFTPKQINAPEAVLCVPEEGQPRRSSIARTWPVMHGEDAPHHIFIDFGSKRLIDLLCDPGAAKPWIVLFRQQAVSDDGLRATGAQEFGDWRSISISFMTV